MSASVSRHYVIQMVEARNGNVPFEQLVQERRARGLSFRKIAKEFGISHQTVWRFSGEPVERELAGAAS